MRLFQEYFGGSVHLRSAPITGRRVWCWSAKSSAAHFALESMLPYLTVKKDQANLGLSVTVGQRGRRMEAGELDYRKAIAVRVKSLKHEEAA